MVTATIAVTGGDGSNIATRSVTIAGHIVPTVPQVDPIPRIVAVISLKESPADI